MTEHNQTLFEIFRGDDTAFQVLIQNPDGAPVDITGWTFRATMKLNFMSDDSTAAVVVNVENLTGSQAEAGVFMLLLPHAQTDLLIPAPYFFDLQRELEGLVTTIIRGRVRVHADVTCRNNDTPGV